MKTISASAVLATVFAGALPAVAAPGTFHVRNGSQTIMLCGLDVTRGGRYHRFQLRPGQAFRHTFDNDRERALACSSSRYLRTGFRVRAGQVYELYETSSGDLRLRTINR